MVYHLVYRPPHGLQRTHKCCNIDSGGLTIYSNKLANGALRTMSGGTIAHRRKQSRESSVSYFVRPPGKHVVYTIGHSNHRLDEFVAMLQSFAIKDLIDIRRLPGSRKYPWFDQENLEISLKENGIHYVYLKELGGRRKVQKDSKNNRWHNASFRGYADYMETEDFERAIVQLETVALKHSTAYMCAEAVWWRCHRSMVSDYLKAKGWTVLHIMAPGKTQEHPYTSPARIVGDRVVYSDENL